MVSISLLAASFFALQGPILDFYVHDVSPHHPFIWVIVIPRANSVFWTRALNIPFPHSYVFPKEEDDQDAHHCKENTNGASDHEVPCGVLTDKEEQRSELFLY